MSEPQQQINVGQVANDGTGESLRDAFNAVNNNFANVWAAGPVDSQVVISNNRISTNETNLDLILAGNGVGNVTVASTTVPSIDAVYDLGRANRRFDEVHAVYYYGNGAYLTGITGNGGGGPNVYFSQGAPDDASIGDIWIESDTGVQYLYFNDDTSNQWAEMEAYQSFSSGGTYGNANVVANLAALGSNPVSSTGNVTGGNLLTGAQVVASGVIQTGTGFSTGGYLSVDGDTDLHKTTVTGNLSATGNITANVGSFFIGNGSQLTGIVSSYGNANVVANLAALGSNPVSTTGNITGGNLTTAGIANVATLAVTGSATVQGSISIFSSSTSLSATGNVIGGNVKTVGLISATGNVTGNYFIGNGSQLTGIVSSYGNANVVANLIALGTNPVSTTGNISGNYFFGNGSQLTGVTGNVTFSDQIVIGTGISNLVSGLYLSPSSSSANALQYLRVRGDVSYEPTHIHFDTGNNQYFNQFIGDDNKYVLLSNTGNIVINTDNYVGNSAQWTFGTDGTLTLPAGSSRITSYGQITIETDNNASGMYLNADGVNLLYANANVTLRANSIGTNKDWNFGNTGNTAFPNGAVFTGYDLYAAANSYIELAGSNDNTYVGLDNNSVFVQTDWNNTQKQWTFDSAGNLTLPGNLTLSNGAVLKDTAGDSVSFGQGAGQTTQGEQAVAIGLQAGFTSQGNYAVAIGKFSANSSQGSYAVAVGPNAGYENQLANAVAIGSSAGASSQGINSVAVGVNAAYNTQGNNAVAVGNSAAYLLQGSESVAIGVNAGIYYLGNNAIAIGANAGNNLQGNNSIVFNATGSNLRNTTANTFTVAPVRNDVANTGQVVFYNTSSKEVTYGNTISVAGNVTGNYFFGNGSQLSGVATQVTGSWNVPVGNSTQSFTVNSGTYSMWVDCNIPNGILVWNATATVTNTNVPVVGAQYAWVYNGGGTPIDFTSIPNQFVGTANAILRSNTAPSSTTNRFDFGINNTSGGNVTVRYGYTEL